MRPSPILDNIPTRSRNRSTDVTSNTAAAAAATASEPYSFVLARESDLSRVSTGASASSGQDASSGRISKATLDEADVTSDPLQAKQSNRPLSRRRSTVKPHSIEGLRQEAIKQQTYSQLISGTLTPSVVPSQEPSLPSSPKSLSARSIPKSEDYLTQDESSSSQAIDSEEEEGEEDESNLISSSIDNSAPQLIMPSIRMPSRRPFTDRGKSLGRLKILVAGRPGCGKTSLIKSIVQLCEDIVHVDPLPTSLSTQKRSSHSSTTSSCCTEIYASSKPYPAWWNQTDDSRVLKRRKSMGDQVLDRNICFVDTQGNHPSRSIESYIEEQLLKTIQCTNQPVTELVDLMSGKGGAQVDLVLYLVTFDNLDHDRDQIRKLSEKVNTIPLIAKSDILTSEQIQEVKQKLHEDICAIPQLPITHDMSSSQANTAHAPYTVSSIAGPDFDTMDASLLMSSEYIQPLLPSELSLLIDQIFHHNNAAYLRHMSAKKLISWYNSPLHAQSAPSDASLSQSQSKSASQPSAPLAASGMLVRLRSRDLSPSLNTSNSFTLARIADHTIREERLAHLRLSKWAADLHTSLRRERERYESVARSDRASWLAEKLEEEIHDGQIVPVSSNRGARSRSSASKDQEKGHRQARIIHNLDGTISVYGPHDPLNVMVWQDVLRQQGWLTLQVVGTFGVMGGLAIWFSRQFDVDELVGEWLWRRWHDLY